MKQLLFVLLFLFIGNVVHAEEIHTVRIQPGPEEGKDASYGTAFHLGPEPEDPTMRAGGWGDHYYSYIEFDLSDIPAEAIVSNATLNLYQFTSTAQDNYVKVTRIVEPWSENSVSRSTNPAYADIGSSWSFVPAIPHWWVEDVTALAAGWIAADYPNYGLRLEGQLNDNRIKFFYSSDYLDDPSLRPYLEITYTLPEEEPETPEELIANMETIVEEEVTARNVQKSYQAHVKKLFKFYENFQTEALVQQVQSLLKKVAKDLGKGNVSEDTGVEIETTGTDLLDLISAEQVSTTEVPLMTQIASPYTPGSEDWENDLYGSGDPDWCGNTIGGCGCAISSLSMLAQGNGVTKGYDGTAINPRNLNNWLIENNGYTPNNGVIWNYALQYFGNKKGFSQLHLDHHNEENSVLIDQYVTDEKVAIGYKRSKGHYFALTDVLAGGMYAVRDPFWFETKTTNDSKDIANHVQGYGGAIDSANLFSFSKNARPFPAWIEIHLGSPAELLIVDSQGRKAGYDPDSGLVLTEIPGSSYSQAQGVVTADTVGPEVHLEKVLTILRPEEDLYDLQVIGTGEGSYALTVATNGGYDTAEIETVFSSTTLDHIDAYVVDIPDSVGESKAAERLRAVADAKNDPTGVVAQRLRAIADRLTLKNMTQSTGGVLHFID